MNLRLHSTFSPLLAILAFSIIAGVLVFFQQPQSRPTRSEPTTTSKSDDIRITTPVASEAIRSPVTIRGEAKGTWFFEGTFPIHLLDNQGNELAQTSASASGEWTTENFVPFEAMFSFVSPSESNGSLLFEKANPSGLDENSGYYSLPIHFK